MEENKEIKEFYDYLRYAISIAQYKMPVIVIEDIKKNISEYLDKMTKEELDNIEKTLEFYDIYYLERCNLIEKLKKNIEESPYNKEISSVFVDNLGDLSAKLERLDFIRSFIATVTDLIDVRVIHQL